MTEQLWNLAEICATKRFADDVVVRTPDDKNWSTTVGKLRSLSADVLASASNAATWSEARAILNVGTIAQLRAAGDFPAPDIYAADLAKLKTASATSESFEEAWKRDRLAALDAEYRRLDAHIDAHPTPRTAEGGESHPPPPNPHEAGIKALRERSTMNARRARANGGGVAAATV